MGRRETFVHFKCGHLGCSEYANYRCDNRREVADLQRRYHPDKWRCVRHTKPDEVLSESNLVKTAEFQVFELPNGRYWGDAEKVGSGFVYGPGFKAYADDFPPGTRLRVTAEIIRTTLKETEGERK